MGRTFGFIILLIGIGLWCGNYFHFFPTMKWADFSAMGLGILVLIMTANRA